MFWLANALNPRGQVTQETLGNGVVTNHSFDAVTGWASAVTSGVSGGSALQNDSYLFDEVGNLIQRQNNNAGLTENIYYDNLYRLDHSTLGGTQNLALTYDASGNITARSDVAAGATWTYDLSHVHAVTQAGNSSFTYSYDANGNAITRNGLGITWTSYNHPSLINGQGGEAVQFAYNQNHEHWKVITSGNAGVETTYFVGSELEKVITAGLSDYRHYIFAGNAKVAVYSRTSGGANTLHYVREDHLGGAEAILNSDGSTYAKESFTAFGARRSTCTWSGAPTNGSVAKINAVSRHGFTWQMALGSLGLNDMVGRVQDAITGRFLSADPFGVQPEATQSFNRYSYVQNNPLSLIDRSGFGIGPRPEDDGDGTNGGTGDSAAGGLGAGWHNSQDPTGKWAFATAGQANSSTGPGAPSFLSSGSSGSESGGGTRASVVGDNPHLGSGSESDGTSSAGGAVSEVVVNQPRQSGLSQGGIDAQLFNTTVSVFNGMINHSQENADTGNLVTVRATRPGHLQPAVLWALPGVSSWTNIGNLANVAAYITLLDANPKLAGRLQREVQVPDGGALDFALDGSEGYELKPYWWQYGGSYNKALNQLNGYLASGGYSAGTWADLGIRAETVGVAGIFSGYGLTLSGQFIFHYDASNAGSGLLFYQFYGSYRFTPGVKGGVRELTFLH